MLTRMRNLKSNGNIFKKSIACVSLFLFFLNFGCSEKKEYDVVAGLKNLKIKIDAIEAGKETVALDKSEPATISKDFTPTEQMMLKVVLDFEKTLTDRDYQKAIEFVLTQEGASFRWLLARLLIDRDRIDDASKIILNDLIDHSEKREYRMWKWWEANFGKQKNYKDLSHHFTDSLLRLFEKGSLQERQVIAELFGKGEKESKLSISEFKKSIGYKD